MSPRLLRPRASGATHPEAIDWATRVTANGGTASSTTLAAVSAFCASIDSAGLRDRFYRLSLFCGDQLTAALVPLYRAESSTAAIRGNATDTNNGPFVEADYAATGANGGLVGNGASKFLNTGLLANSIAATDAHLAFSLRTAQTAVNAGKCAIGTYATTGQVAYAVDISKATNNPEASAIFGVYTTGASFFGELTNTSPAAIGHIVASSITAAANQYRNGSAVGSTGTARANYTLAHPLYVFANNNGGTSAAANHTNARLGGYSIGLGMTQAQAQAYSNAVSAFNTALSRT
jgi:hypothetical protein